MMIADKIKIDYTKLRPEEQIPAHSQDSWELVYVITGSGERTIGDTTEAFCEGEVILIPPEITHSWIFNPSHTDSEGNIADIALFIKPDLLYELALILPDFSECIKSIGCRREAVKFAGQRRKMIQKLLLRMTKALTPEIKVIFFLSLLSLIGDSEVDEVVVGRSLDISPTKKKVEKVRIYCECNYMKRICLGDAARHAGMNVSSFCKFFSRNFKCSFTEYINRLRINESCRLLKSTADPVADIAYSSGFSSVHYFNRIFRRICDCTPLQYRSSAEA